MTLIPEDPRHATANGYNNLGCRCSPCKRAWSMEIQAARKRRSPLSPDDPRHGKETTYSNWKCRCDLCRAARAAYKTASRARKTGAK